MRILTLNGIHSVPFLLLNLYFITINSEIMKVILCATGFLCLVSSDDIADTFQQK
jgi:hypothetical protein